MNPPTEKRVAALDGLRGMAIALVLWHHLVEAYLPLDSSSWLGWLRAGTSLSWSGVDLFFVLSGYFIGGILLDQRTSPRLARTFYWRRAVRIVPLYAITLALTLGLVASRVAGSAQLFPAWIYSLFLTNFGIAWENSWDWFPLSILWSIAVEEQFYLAAPWIARWVPANRLPILLLSLIGLAWLLRTGCYYFYPTKLLAIMVLMPMRMDTLALGVLLAWAVRTETTAPFWQRLARTWPVWLAATAALVFLLAVNHTLHLEQIAVYYGYSVLAVGYALLVAIVAVIRPPRLVSLLASRLPTSLGRYSYFIYLWHMLIGWSIIKWLGGPNFVLNSLPGAGIVFLALLATWVAGRLSWKYFECPLLKFAHRSSY